MKWMFDLNKKKLSLNESMLFWILDSVFNTHVYTISLYNVTLYIERDAYM